MSERLSGSKWGGCCVPILLHRLGSSASSSFCSLWHCAKRTDGKGWEGESGQGMIISELHKIPWLFFQIQLLGYSSWKCVFQCSCPRSHPRTNCNVLSEEESEPQNGWGWKGPLKVQPPCHAECLSRIDKVTGKNDHIFTKHLFWLGRHVFLIDFFPHLSTNHLIWLEGQLST